MRAGVIFVVIVAAICAGALAFLKPTHAEAQPPVPIPSESGLGVQTFEGWEKVTSGLPRRVKYLHRPSRDDHEGSAVWFYDHPSSDLRAAVVASAAAQGIGNVEILSQARMRRATILDSGGHGASFIADGVRDGKPYRLAALALYGRMKTSDPRSTGVHMFAAPARKYASMGGWVVPASLWLNLDPATEVADSFEQGSAAPDLQAQRLSMVGDIWAQWAFETYVSMMQSNLTAMENARKTIVCSGDPSCEIVTGY